MKGVLPARGVCLFVGLLAVSPGLRAALPQVANLKVQSGGTLAWDPLAGAVGYNAYKGDVAGLRTGNYGACLVGSVQGSSSAVPAGPVPYGTAVFFLVDGFDESGEGQVADAPAASPAPRCVPARRFFNLVPDGDAGDGIADGTAPLRNPDILPMYSSHQETAGVLLSSGEFVFSALDLDIIVRTSAGTLLHEIGHNLGQGHQTAVVVGAGGEEIYPDKYGRIKVQFHWDRDGKKDDSSNNRASDAGSMAHGSGGGSGKATYGAIDFTGEKKKKSDRAGLGVLDPLGYRTPYECARCHGGDEGSVAGLSMPYQVARTYRSQVLYKGPLGQGWDFPANARVAPSGGDVVYFDGSGRRETFVRLDSTHFAPTAGRYALLSQNAAGSFVLRNRDGALQAFHAFDGSNRSGSLDSAQDRQGDQTTFLYDAQGLLTTVVDPLGRALTYSYNPDGTIASIADSAGRTVVYSYDSLGNLTAARSPVVTGTPNGNDFPSGRTERYTYSSGFADERLNHDLIGVIRPDEASSGAPAVTNVYGTDPAALTFDRVVSQTIGGTNSSGIAAGGTLTLSYQSLNAGGNPADLTLPRRMATLTDRNGNRRDYVHNISGNCIAMTEYTNRELRPGEADYTTRFGYDSDGELILVMRPQGDRTALTYDKPGADRYREGNLIMVRSTADSPATGTGGRGDGHGGESNDIVSTFTYEPIFNQVASETEPRGNDPAYVPQNGGTGSPARYTRTFTFDYQEGDPLANGVSAYASRYGISLAGATFGLGDVNGDGGVLQAQGNIVRVADPAVHLDPASMQAGIQGGTLQSIVTGIVWNGHGQPVALTDPEGNRHAFAYYPETDPDGDGTPTPAPPDGRALDPATGGYPKTLLIDTIQSAGRDNGGDPGPVNKQIDLMYDPFGSLAGVVDGRGVATRFVHNALGELVEVRRADATADASGADGTPPTGRGETGLAPFGFLVRYAYDADGNVTSLQREDRGATRGVGPFLETRFTYDILDDEVQSDRVATSRLTLSTRYRYDANQNPVQLTEPDGNTFLRSYDERDLLLSSTRGSDGPFGGAPSMRRYDYDGDGGLTRLTDGRGGLTDYFYDGHDRPARLVDPVGNTTDLFYDPAGEIVRLLGRGPAGGPTPADRSGSGNVDLTDLRALYDEMLRRIRVDDRLFVPAGVSPARPVMLSEGALLPGDGATNTIFEYDRLSRATFTHEDSGALTRVDYDGAGRAIARNDPAGDTEQWTWDAADNPVESVGTEVATNPGPQQEQFLTTLFYDALGRGTTLVDNLGETWRTFYDSLDAPTAATDANGPSGGSILRRSASHAALSVPINGNGNVTRYAYDAAGRLLTSTRVLTMTGKGDGTVSPPPDPSNPSNPDGLITGTTVWTNDGLPGQWIDDKGNATTYAYDNLDRTIRVGRSDGFVQQIGYDAEDNAVSAIDPNGTQVANTFDAAGRLTMTQASPPPAGGGVSGTTLRTYEYDGRSRLTRAFDNNQPADSLDDANLVFLYDSLGRPIEEAQMPPPGSGAPRYSDFGWQAEGLLSSLTYPSGDQVLYAYDGAERLRNVNDMMHPELMATFDYIGLGRLSTRMYGNGVRLTFLDDTGTLDTGYDGVGRPIRMRHLDPAGTLLAGFDYRYDRVGNRTAARRLHDTDPLGNARGNVYAFDSADRLIASQEAYLDSFFNVAGAVSDSIAWTLDGPGNWANLTRNGSVYLNTPNNLNEYDEPQCCGAHSEDGLKDDFMDLASTPTPDGLNLTYDKNGNQTDTSLQALDYNFANIPVAARNLSTGAAVSAYAYDALGRRTKRQVTSGPVPAGTSTFDYGHALFPGAVEEDDTVGTLIRQFGFGAGGRHLWQYQANGTSQYLLEDAFGSTVALTPGMSAGGPPNVLERVVYDPYGKPTFENAANQPLKDILQRFTAQSPNGNAYLFEGMRYDPELGSRTSNVNTDFGGLYAAAGCYNPNEGRPMRVGKAPGPTGVPAGGGVSGSAESLVPRLMEEEGIFYFFKHSDGKHGLNTTTPRYGRAVTHIPRIGSEVIVAFEEGDPDRPLPPGGGRGGFEFAPVSGWKLHGSGKPWGVAHIPRIGSEVIVAFEEGDPDRPLLPGGERGGSEFAPVFGWKVHGSGPKDDDPDESITMNYEGVVIHYVKQTDPDPGSCDHCWQSSPIAP